jgi:hypothetical protein
MTYLSVTNINLKREGRKLLIPVLPYSRTQQKLFEIFVSTIDFALVKGHGSIMIRLPKARIPIDHLSPSQVLAMTALMAEKPITLMDMNCPKYPPIKALFFTNVFNRKNHFEFITHWKCAKLIQELRPKYEGYELDTLLSFESSYSTPLYKILRIQESQKRTVFNYSIEDLSRLLAVDLADYSDYGSYQTRVLKPIFSEITEHPTHPIDFEYSTNALFDNSINNIYVTNVYFRINMKTRHHLIQKTQKQKKLMNNPIPNLNA